ncbi:hypothetical protein [Shewanella colwelliana]|uniref:hypothetical protein n=1 Tax=Shewanella colwelliana TaxID=23 RepID=UPI0022AE5DA5|nr:hypothetical protein [Shewanella colwelliana]MCZ4337646.1 hypothetical protein [Shewanella colwelliana]
MTNSTYTEHPLSAAVDAHLKKSPQTKSVPACGLTISFYHTDHLKEIKQQFERVIGDLEWRNGYLVKLCANQDDARKMTNALRTVLHRARGFQIETPFKRGWLVDLLHNESFGVNVCMPRPEISTEQMFNKLTKRDADNSQGEYFVKQQRAREAVGEYGLKELTADLADFIFANYDCQEQTHAEVMVLINKLISSVFAQFTGRISSENHCLWRTLRAIQNKADFMLLSTIEEPSEQVAAYRLFQAQLKDAENYAKQSVTWQEMFQAIFPHTETLLATCKPGKVVTPYRGIDFDYSDTRSLNGLCAEHLADISESRCEPIETIIAALLTDHLLGYARERYRYNLKQLLHEVADELDTREFGAELRNLYEQASPFGLGATSTKPGC